MTLCNSDMRRAILKGIEKANRDHLKWTRNCWVSDYGAEGLIQARIAESIFSMDPELGVWLEANLSEIAHRQSAGKMGAKKMSGQARPDISTYLLSRGTHSPEWEIQHIVEVKRRWEKAKVASDVVRCATFAKILGNDKKTGLKAAFFAIFLTTGPNRHGATTIFFDPDAEDHLKRAVSSMISDEENNLLQAVKIKADLGDVHKFRQHPNLAHEGNYHGWRWRSAVIQFTPTNVKRGDK